jgi:hemolysin-activating ACP:hemolysin acyltransferase
MLSGKRETMQDPIREAQKDLSSVTTEEGLEMVAPLGGNRTVAWSLNRLNEMVARRNQMRQEYEREADDLLRRMDEGLGTYRT